MKTYKFRATFGMPHVFERLFRRLGSTRGRALAAAFLAFSSYSAMGAAVPPWTFSWPPTLQLGHQPPKWDWQLANPITVNPDPTIKIYDIEMFQNEKSGAVQALHSKGYKVICYVDVGSWENWRDDAGAFPPSILGAKYHGFPDERWLDIRGVWNANSILRGILKKRFNRAKAMGCDAIEPDNMDGYDTTAHEKTGFPLTYQDQIAFNLWVSSAVHYRGMLVGLKNDINQAQNLSIIAAFDFVVSEECFQYNECGYFSGFLNAKKPVFEAEYALALSKFCPQAKASRISAIKKRNSLDATRSDCSAYY